MFTLSYFILFAILTLITKFQICPSLCPREVEALFMLENNFALHKEFHPLMKGDKRRKEIRMRERRRTRQKERSRGCRIVEN